MALLPVISFVFFCPDSPSPALQVTDTGHDVCLHFPWLVKTRDIPLHTPFAKAYSPIAKGNFLSNGNVVVSTGSTPVHLHLPTNVLKIAKVE